MFRQDAELALDIFRKVVFAGVGFAVGEGNYHAVGHQLQQVAVSGDYLNAQPFFPRRPDCQAADDVIRFVVFQFQPGNIEGIHHLADALHLPAQVFGHFGASALVFRIEVVSEGAAGIERDSQIVGLVLFQDAQQGAGEAEHASGWLARAGCPTGGAAGSEREVGTVGQRVAVQKVENFWHDDLVSSDRQGRVCLGVKNRAFKGLENLHPTVRIKRLIWQPWWNGVYTVCFLALGQRRKKRVLPILSV